MSLMSLPTLFDDDESDLSPLTDTDFSDDDDSDFEQGSSTHKPARKRRRVEKPKPKPKPKEKKRRGYKGALADMWILPLDITYEIFGHLRPLDLLHLARTSRELRRIVMTPRSKSAWMQARKNVLGNVPDCPFDLSEPRYASLLFEPICHYCSASNVQTIIWEARIRCCKRCGNHMFQYWANMTESIPSILQPIIPSTHEFSTGTIYKHTEKKYSVEIAARLATEMAKLSEDAKPLWFWNQKKDYDSRVEHAALCREWLLGQAGLRGLQLGELRLQRTQKIIQKLIDLGWSQEMYMMSSESLLEHRHVKVPKLLTDRAWQKIEPEMVAFMETTRIKRLAKERGAVIDKRCALMKEMYAQFLASQPLHSILPGVEDYATIPTLKAILENPNLDTPVSLADFQLGTEAMLEFAAKWREEKDNELLGILRQSSLGPTVEKDCLQRASTVFNCKSCNVPISYPRILVHACNFSRTSAIPDPTSIFDRLKSDPWNLGGDRISFHEAAHGRAKFILKALRLSPDTTYDELKTVNPFVECICALCYRRTENGGSTRTVARWEHMIEHTPRYTSARVVRPYLPVDPYRSGKAAARETEDLAKLRQSHDWSDYSYRSYICMHCKVRDTRCNIEVHLRKTHQVPLPTFDTDYTYHLDARICLRAPFVYMKVKQRPLNPTSPPTESEASSASNLTAASPQPPAIASEDSSDGALTSTSGAVSLERSSSDMSVDAQTSAATAAVSDADPEPPTMDADRSVPPSLDIISPPPAAESS